MKKLIKMYNEKYGDTLGVIDDDFNKEQMYRIYYFIKNNCDDKEIQARLEKIKLDKPKTLEQQLTKLEGENNKGGVQDTDLPHTISSKVLVTVPAKDIKIEGMITVNNVSINKDRRYFIEFLGNKKLCNLIISAEIGNGIMCSIDNYFIQLFSNTQATALFISAINTDDTTVDTFTDLIIYEEEIKCLDSKYLETDLTLQNSISLGRVGKIGMGSSAIGAKVEASGNGSHAEGEDTTASGNDSHAEGMSTTASGDYSHAEGSSTTASGDASHAEGGSTIASGLYSHAEGINTKASSKYQHVQGKYNIEDNNNIYAHIVGNGKRDKSTNYKEVRSNAHTLDWQGNGWFAGKLSQESAPTEDKDLTTKKYVDDSLNNMFSFNESGELVVTINGVSKIFVPKS